MSNQEEVNVSTTATNVPEDLMFNDDPSDLIGHLDGLMAQVDEINEMYGGEVEMYGAASDRLDALRKKAGGMWANVKSSLGDFFKKLTTRTNGKLPDWVYGASEGVLQSMIEYIEEKLSEDGDNNKVPIEMLRQGINALRSRIIDASKGLPEPVEQKKKPETNESDD